MSTVHTRSSTYFWNFPWKCSILPCGTHIISHRERTTTIRSFSITAHGLPEDSLIASFHIISGPNSLCRLHGQQSYSAVTDMTSTQPVLKIGIPHTSRWPTVALTDKSGQSIPLSAEHSPFRTNRATAQHFIRIGRVHWCESKSHLFRQDYWDLPYPGFGYGYVQSGWKQSLFSNRCSGFQFLTTINTYSKLPTSRRELGISIDMISCFLFFPDSLLFPG